MRSIRAKNIVVILAFLIAVAGAGVLIFRPEWIPYDSFLAGIENVKVYISGKLNGGEATDLSTAGKKSAVHDQPPVKKDMYRLDLKSGGRVYTDNLKIGDGKLSYETNKGLIVTINSYEVVGVKKFKEGEEPVD